MSFIANEGVFTPWEENGMNYEAAKFHIFKIAKTPEQAAQYAAYLAAQDWEELFRERRQRDENIIQSAVDNGGGFCDACKDLSHNKLVEPIFPHVKKGKYCMRCISQYQKNSIEDPQEWYHSCEYCHAPYQEKYLIHNHPVIKIEYHGYCANCIQDAENKLRITCDICGVVTMAHTDPRVCNDCYTKYPYSGIVNTHRNRALALNLPATLTLAEWKRTIEYFNHKCAYCNQPYEVLEHYIALTKGGGTTASNCVPACKACNSRKGNKKPANFEQIFPADNITRIKAYFASVTVTL